jgi:cell division protein FtsI/penicillin-binding protein 2
MAVNRRCRGAEPGRPGELPEHRQPTGRRRRYDRRYQAGSTFKLFTMLAALESGLPLDTSFDAPSRIVTRLRFRRPGQLRGRWCPENAN